MEREIDEKLTQLEREFGIHILLAVESGSRAWGFASPDSDWDVRFIYTKPLAHYLSVNERRDVMEFPHKWPPLDLSGWDLKKALKLLSKSNPPLIEWLTSTQIYRFSPIAQELQNMVAKYFNPRAAIYHYLHMANGNFRMYLQLEQVRTKKYFYVIRPLLACEEIERSDSWPPVALFELIKLSKSLANNPEVRDRILELHQRKIEGDELATGPRINALDIWIRERLEHFSEVARTTTKYEKPLDDLDEFFYRSLVP